MSSHELKKEIEKLIENFPDQVLEEVFHYLKNLENLSEEQTDSAEKIKKILREDSSLLKKLAE